MQLAMISSSAGVVLDGFDEGFLPSGAFNTYTEKKWDISFMMCSGSSLMSS